MSTATHTVPAELNAYHHVEIRVTNSPFLKKAKGEIRVYRDPRKAEKSGYREYPFNTRNYWRAIGMQQRMLEIQSRASQTSRAEEHAHV